MIPLTEAEMAALDALASCIPPGRRRAFFDAIAGVVPPGERGPGARHRAAAELQHRFSGTMRLDAATERELALRAKG
jgi:hypothetical protein